MTIETHQKELDSLLSGLDSKYKEFEVEIDALRDTYDEDHKTLEDLYRLNAESRTSISNLEEDIKTRFSEVQSKQSLKVDKTWINGVIDSLSKGQEGKLAELQVVYTKALELSQEKMADNMSYLDTLKKAMPEESIYILKQDVLSGGTRSTFDSTMADLQLALNEQVFYLQKEIDRMSHNVVVQDSSIYDILSQMVLLENKIISLTNSFTEILGMTDTETLIAKAKPSQSDYVPATSVTVIDKPVNAIQTKPPVNAETYKNHYIDALSSYQNRSYAEAVKEFKVLLEQSTSHDLADNAQYWIGESYYGMEDYTKAVEEFTKVFSFNDSNKADSAQFKIGYCYLNMNNTKQAKIEFQKVITRFPESEYVERVNQILSRL